MAGNQIPIFFLVKFCSSLVWFSHTLRCRRHAITESENPPAGGGKVVPDNGAKATLTTQSNCIYLYLYAYMNDNHTLRGTRICMGRRGGNEGTEVTPKHTKNQWDADTDSNTYFDRIKSEYCGILLWTQHQNIHRMPRKGCDFSQILLMGRRMIRMPAKWVVGYAVNQQLWRANRTTPERPQKLYFSKGGGPCTCNHSLLWKQISW